MWHSFSGRYLAWCIWLENCYFDNMFYRSLAAHSCVSDLLVHTRGWVYGKIILHSLFYFARARPVDRFIKSKADLKSMNTCRADVHWLYICQWFRSVRRYHSGPRALYCSCHLPVVTSFSGPRALYWSCHLSISFSCHLLAVTFLPGTMPFIALVSCLLWLYCQTALPSFALVSITSLSSHHA